MVYEKKNNILSTDTDILLSELILNGLDKLEGIDNENPFFFDVAAINNIPVIRLDGLTEKEIDAISILSKEVLIQAKRNNNYKEVSITYRTDMNVNKESSKAIVMGDEISTNFLEDEKTRKILFESPNNIIMNFHNHMNNSSYSVKDITIFTSFPQIKMMELINHKGQVSVLYKKEARDDLRIIPAQIIRLEIPDIRTRIDMYNLQHEEKLNDITKIMTTKEQISIVKKEIELLENMGVIYLDYKGKEDLEEGIYYGR